MIKDLGELGLNLQKIVTRLLYNQNLVKFLYYTDKDPLNNPDLSDAQLQNEVFEKLVKIVPRIVDKEDAKSFLSIKVDRGIKDSNNSDFIGLKISIEVFTPLTQWIIKNSNLRPFCVLGEIQKSLDNKIINGLGRLEGGDFELSFITNEISCYETVYHITMYD